MKENSYFKIILSGITVCLLFTFTGIIFPEMNKNNLYLRSDEDIDSSGFSSDGPVIIYENNKIMNYSVVPAISLNPDNKVFSKSIKEIFKSDTLLCYVDETGQEFSFTLKDEISIENDTYDQPDKMLIISDIEGNFKGFQSILRGAGVIDENLKWSYGNGHLVLPGDFFDRGINVTEVLWLIYKLEDEAIAQGGKVHFILGNHEVMNMRDDFRYVRKKYPDNADSLGLEYGKWYDENSELGRWLRSKNGIVRIGNYLFLHAGISKDFPSDSLMITQINNGLRESIDLTYEKGESRKNIFIGSNSPIWYRGIMNEEETQADVEKTLQSFNSDKMILGHTVVDSIKYLYDGRVIGIDLDHAENIEKGIMYALLFENGEFYAVNNFNNKIKL